MAHVTMGMWLKQVTLHLHWVFESIGPELDVVARSDTWSQWEMCIASGENAMPKWEKALTCAPWTLEKSLKQVSLKSTWGLPSHLVVWTFHLSESEHTTVIGWCLFLGLSVVGLDGNLTAVTVIYPSRQSVK